MRAFLSYSGKILVIRPPRSSARLSCSVYTFYTYIYYTNVYGIYVIGGRGRGKRTNLENRGKKIYIYIIYRTVFLLSSSGRRPSLGSRTRRTGGRREERGVDIYIPASYVKQDRYRGNLLLQSGRRLRDDGYPSYVHDYTNPIRTGVRDRIPGQWYT